MSQEDLVVGHATTPGVSSEGKQAAHLTMELEYENQVVWVAVLASSDGILADGTTASQFVVSQVYNGLIQSVQPIPARLRESIYRANLELIGAAGASVNEERPHVSVLVAAVSNTILNVAYVGDIVGHIWRDGVTFPITGNHNQYVRNTAAQGIDNRERLGMYPDMPIHSMVIEQTNAPGGPGNLSGSGGSNGSSAPSPSNANQERYRMGDYIVLGNDSLLIITANEVGTHYIGETIGRTGPMSDPGVLANGLVTSPTIVGGPDDVTAIVLRHQGKTKRKAAISGRLLSALLGFVLFAGAFGGLLFTFPKLAEQLRITVPNTPVAEVRPVVNDEQTDSTATVGELLLTDSEPATSTPDLADDGANVGDGGQPTATVIPEEVVALAATATNTAINTATSTATSTATKSPTATASDSSPSVTRQGISLNPTSTPAELATWTPMPTATPSASNTPTATTATKTATAAPTFTSAATSTPTSTGTSPATPTPANTATRPPPTNTATPQPPTSTPTPRPTATKPASDIKSLQLVSPPDNAQGSGRQKFEWTFWGTLAADQKFEVVFWEPQQDAMTDGFGIAGTTSNTRISVDLDTLGRQLSLLKSGIAYNWGVLLVTEEPYTRLELLSGNYSFTFSGGGGRSSSSRDTAGE